MSRCIDINCDLGESFGYWKIADEGPLLDVASSANVACGFHAGDPTTMLATIRAARARGVAIGAHVSYPDLRGFGRRAMDISPEDLKADVIYQIGALKGLAAAAGHEVGYVKPHGALYNTIATDPTQARAVIEAILAIDPELILLGLAGSPLIGWAAEAGLTVRQEIFADRALTADGNLVDRRLPGAVLTDHDLVAQRLVRIVTEGVATAVDGTRIALRADSVCVHGDTPDATRIASGVRAALTKAGIDIRAFGR